MQKKTLPEWERVLAAAAHLQRILPEAVMVGGSASVIYAGHRISLDSDHVLTDLVERFDPVLAQLESVAGWETARITRPVQILGSLDGIETGVRQLIRNVPLETVKIEYRGQEITVPTEAEILRIKGVLILKRNATRDYLDFVALSEHLGAQKVVTALQSFDLLYPQPNGESALQQLQIQLGQPLPYDLEEHHLAEYKSLEPRWHNWGEVKRVCFYFATIIFDEIIGQEH